MDATTQALLEELKQAREDRKKEIEDEKIRRAEEKLERDAERLLAQTQHIESLQAVKDAASQSKLDHDKEVQDLKTELARVEAEGKALADKNQKAAAFANLQAKQAILTSPQKPSKYKDLYKASLAAQQSTILTLSVPYSS